MNVRNTPIAGLPYSFWIVVAIMAVLAGGMFAISRKTTCFSASGRPNVGPESSFFPTIDFLVRFDYHKINLIDKLLCPDEGLFCWKKEGSKVRGKIFKPTYET